MWSYILEDDFSIKILKNHSVYAEFIPNVNKKSSAKRFCLELTNCVSYSEKDPEIVVLFMDMLHELLSDIKNTSGD